MRVPDVVQKVLGIFPAGSFIWSAELAVVTLHLTGTCPTRSLSYILEADHATLRELHVPLVGLLISR